MLPHVEDGTITLIGATTENPSFEVIGPLLSRSRVFRLEPLSAEQIEGLLRRALTDEERGIASMKVTVDDETLKALANISGGDARIALNALELAGQALRQGLAIQQRHGTRRERFPASGLHWMLGLIHLRRGDAASAIADFTEEIELAGPQLYATEFAVAARVGWGFALLSHENAGQALEVFGQALELNPSEPRASLGRALAFRRLKEPADAEQEMLHAREHIDALQKAGRNIDVLILGAAEEVVRDRPVDALNKLQGLLADAPAGSAGWTIPIEPLFAPLRALPEYTGLIATLAARAK